MSAPKGITRFISTHPDQDHISGLAALDDAIPIVNFYCVKNSATKKDETVDVVPASPKDRLASLDGR